MDMYDREMEDLETDLANGVISQEEFNKSVRRLQREYREEAMQSAEDAYKSELDKWF